VEPWLKHIRGKESENDKVRQMSQIKTKEEE
jgi:hypothetical protein